MELKYSKVRDVKSPKYSTDGSAGIDLFIPTGFGQIVRKNEHVLIPSGIKFNIPKDHALIAFNKSGIVLNKKLFVGATVCDHDYQGEVHISLINHNDFPVVLKDGEKIIQFVLMYAPQADIIMCGENELFETKTLRAENGFGSTSDN